MNNRFDIQQKKQTTTTELQIESLRIRRTKHVSLHTTLPKPKTAVSHPNVMKSHDLGQAQQCGEV